MDICATEDHEMLTLRVKSGKLVADSYAKETVKFLSGLPYQKSTASSSTKFQHSQTRAVVRSGDNQQPDFHLRIDGMRAVCDWWWQKDEQLNFLRLLGFWLGHGSMSVREGLVIISQRKLECTAWLIDLLDEVFPRSWYRCSAGTDEDGETFNYFIRCPPLFEYLRQMAIGPRGYNPLEPQQLRKYPHFDRSAEVERAESASPYYVLTGCGRGNRSTWTEPAMMAALRMGTVRRPCYVCADASGVRLTCSGERCRHVDAITRAHPACVDVADEEAFAEPWLCDDCSGKKRRRTASASDSVETKAALSDEVDEETAVFLEREVSDDIIAPAFTAKALEMSEDPVETALDAVLAEETEETAADAWVTAVAGAQIVATGIVWNGGVWDIAKDRTWFYHKRWMGPNVAGTFANLSKRQAIALLEGFCRADGLWAGVQFADAAREQPTGNWQCSNSSFPLIDHLMLISQLAGARVDLSRSKKAGTVTNSFKKKSKNKKGRTVKYKVDLWTLYLGFNKTYSAEDVWVARLAKPVDATNVAARGYHQYEDDGHVYDITVADNHNFLASRLALKAIRAAPGAEVTRDVRAGPVYVGNCSFGDFAALSDEVDEATAAFLKREVSDGIIAPSFTPQALAVLKSKKEGAYIILQADAAYSPPPFEYRELYGLCFAQLRNSAALTPAAFQRVVTSEQSTLPPAAVRDLLVACITAKYTQSNSVVYAKDGQTIGVGAGQQSRVDCVKLAGDKAEVWWMRQHDRVKQLPLKPTVKRVERVNARIAFIEGEDMTVAEREEWQLQLTQPTQPLSREEKAQWLQQLQGVSLCSDAFFPFADNIHQCARRGVHFIAQTGGSRQDQQVIDAANRYGMRMAFTDIRLFHH